MEEFASHGHTIYVVCSIEKRHKKETFIEEASGIKILRVKTGNITSNPNLISKGLALLSFQRKIITAIKKNLPSIAFNLIIYSTPPIQYNRIIKYLRRKKPCLYISFIERYFSSECQRSKPIKKVESHLLLF